MFEGHERRNSRHLVTASTAAGSAEVQQCTKFLRVPKCYVYG
jgi:hypothetical protein